MDATPAEIEKYLALLEQTPTRISSAIAALDSARLDLKPDKDAWSANDILAHLRSCADVWGNTIIEMLAKDNPTLPHISPRTWIRKTDYPKLEFRPSFEAFVDQRNALLSTLSALAFEDWSRSATIKDRKHTIFTQVRRMALHENEHCEQLAALFNQ